MEQTQEGKDIEHSERGCALKLCSKDRKREQFWKQNVPKLMVGDEGNDVRKNSEAQVTSHVPSLKVLIRTDNDILSD